MTAERNHHEDAERGRVAEFEYRETERAFGAVRAAILNAIAATPPMHADKILKLHMSVQNLAAVRQALLKTLQAGQVAEAALKFEAEQAIAAEGLTRP